MFSRFLTKKNGESSLGRRNPSESDPDLLGKRLHSWIGCATPADSIIRCSDRGADPVKRRPVIYDLIRESPDGGTGDSAGELRRSFVRSSPESVFENPFDFAHFALNFPPD